LFSLMVLFSFPHEWHLGTDLDREWQHSLLIGLALIWDEYGGVTTSNAYRVTLRYSNVYAVTHIV